MRPRANVCQKLRESLHGADVAVARRRRAEPQDFCGFGVSKLLKVPQRQHFPVDLVHRFQCLFEAIDVFLPDKDIAWRGVVGRQFVGNGQAGAVGIGQEPDFLARITLLPKMLAMRHQNLLRVNCRNQT